jgi:hypothetical protein
MNNLEETLRAAVRDLADDAPPSFDLATVARTRGRRIRRRRQVGLVAAVVALLAAAGTPYAVLHRNAPPPEPIQPSPSPSASAVARADWWMSPYHLPGGAVVTALSKVDVGLVDAPVRKTVHDGNVLLDPESGKYVVLPSAYYTIFGSPAGGHALALNGEGGSGLVDSKDSRGTWMDVSIGFPQWSADSSRILYPSDAGFSIMDAATGVAVDHQVLDLNCPDECFYTWLPGDREVAIAERDTAVAHDESKRDQVKQIVIYEAATGKRLRTVPVGGSPIGPDAWSPDGKLVLVFNQQARSNPVRIADVTTGKFVGQIPWGDVHFLKSGRILGLADGVATLYDNRGGVLEKQTLPDDFHDRDLSIGIG